MHGTGLFSALETLVEGGTVVLLASRRFDADELADTIEATGTTIAVIVGDPFARPLLEALRARRPPSGSRRFARSSRRARCGPRRSSTGCSRATRRSCCIDAFSSSEALGMGNSVSVADAETRRREFTLGAGVRVLDEDGPDVVPGSGIAGLLALGGRLPLGYYKDDAKTAPRSGRSTASGTRCPGDWATVRADGSIQLLGRGSQCINTAGEKVFPEEVEEALKTHADRARRVRAGRARRAVGRGRDGGRRAERRRGARRGRAHRPREGPTSRTTRRRAGSAS